MNRLSRNSRLWWFCVLLLGTYVLSLPASAVAAFYDLEDAVSPNGKFVVRLESVSKGGKSSFTLMYAVVNARSGAILARIPSSYQLETGELAGWSVNHAKAALVFWNSISTLVAIDEDVHRYMGKVVVVCINKIQIAKTPNVSEQQLFRITGKQWDKFRIRVLRGWDDQNTLSLQLSGVVVETGSGTSTTNNETSHLQINFSDIQHPRISAE